MSLVFTGPGGSTERRWIVFALLRDNVQHHLEGGTPGESFQSIHGIAAALGGASVSIDAEKLRAELHSARALNERPASELALSTRTLAVISRRWPPPTDEKTELASELGWPIPAADGAQTLGDVFGDLIDELIRVAGAGAGVVEVIDQ
jgi:hypothetical protein